MDRRGLLKGLTTSAVGWVTAGRILDVDAGSHRAYRDPVPLVPAAQAATLGSPAALAVDPALTAQYQASVYPQSVAAGDPNPNGAVIWTRVVLPAGGGSQTIIGWQIATDQGFGQGTVVLQGVATLSAARDNTVKLPIESPALRPFTIYYYRFITLGVASRTGRFKTLPVPGAPLDLLRVGYVVCQDYSNGFYNAYGFLAQEEVDVVVHLGDYIYEYLDDGVGGPNNGPVRVVPPFPSGASYPQGLADYRHLYQVYRSDPQLQAMHERFAMIQLWDDHEFFNDCHQDYHEDTLNPGESATTPKPQLRQDANQAWSEHGLAAVPFDPSQDWSSSIRLYRTFRFGNLLDLVVTDERLYRDGPPCGDLQPQRYQTLGCVERTDPARTMLGATQRQWFIDQVTQSGAVWKVWANEVMLCQYKFGPPLAPAAIFFDLDQWDGYPVERAALLGAIRDAQVKNFVVLSGDAHLYLASYLRTNFDDVTEPPMGVEFMVGAISSGNYLDAGVDAPASNLKSITAGISAVRAMGLPADALEPVVLKYNPHMQFWNGSTWGYAVLTVTPDAMACDFRAVSTVKEPTATLQALASFNVPVNQVQLNAA